MKDTELRDITDKTKMLRYVLPYCFQKMSNFGKNVYLPLNRDYKPIGVISSDYVYYDEYRHLFVRFSSCPSKIKGVWHEVSKDRNDEIYAFYLYSDKLSSREEYYARLAKVMSKATRLK
jgi:hypothetical protein